MQMGGVKIYKVYFVALLKLRFQIVQQCLFFIISFSKAFWIKIIKKETTISIVVTIALQWLNYMNMIDAYNLFYLFLTFSFTHFIYQWTPTTIIFGPILCKIMTIFYVSQVNKMSHLLIKNASNNPILKFSNYISISHFENYSYQYQQFSTQSNNPNMPYGVQLDSSGVQLNDQELATS